MSKIEELKELLKERTILKKDITWGMSDYIEKHNIVDKLKNVEDKIIEIGKSLSKEDLINLIMQ